MVTSADVARAAGTSRAVVSYVVNDGPRNVAEPTRRRVLEAMERLGYRPNPHARALRAASSPVIGVVVSDISNAYCAEMVLALEDAAIARRHTLLIGNAMRDDRRETEHVATFVSQHVHGVVFIGSTEPLSTTTPSAHGGPSGHAPVTVRLDRPVLEPGETAVLVDNLGGAQAAVAHLLSHGYGECALLLGPTTHYGVADRRTGWERALLESGLDPEGQVVRSSAFDRYDAFRVALELLSEERPRAVFASSDEQALGILFAAAHVGVRVPDDLAIVSFDGIRESSLTTPALTTVRQPFAEAGEWVLRLITGPEERPSDARTVVLPVGLRLGGSCGSHGEASDRATGDPSEDARHR